MMRGHLIVLISIIVSCALCRVIINLIITKVVLYMIIAITWLTIWDIIIIFCGLGLLLGLDNLHCQNQVSHSFLTIEVQENKTYYSVK